MKKSFSRLVMKVFRISAKKAILLALCIFAVGCSSVNSRDDIEKESGKASAPSGGDTISTSDLPPGDEAPSSNSPQAPATTFASPNEKKSSAKQLTNFMDIAMKNNDMEGLQKAAQNALAQNSSDVKALTALGVVNFQRKKYLAALYFYNKALQVGPPTSEVHSNIGLVHLALKDRKEAVKAFKKAFDANPSDGIAAANLGSIYAVEGDYNKAMPVLERAVKSGVKDARVYNNYGISLVATGKAEEAKSVYEEAIKMSSGNRDAMYNYAILLIDHLNQFQAGLDYLNKLRFLGLGEGMRERINSLENKAKAGLK